MVGFGSDGASVVLGKNNSVVRHSAIVQSF